MFRSVIVQRPLGPVAKVHGVLSNSNLSPTSAGQPREASTPSNVLEKYYITLDNSKQGF